jgi:hypothetical protein
MSLSSNDQLYIPEETSPMEQRICLITLGVTDLARSRYFYEHGVGWQPSSASNEQVSFFQTGSMVLALYGKTALAQDAHLLHEGTGFGGIALAHKCATA